MVEEKTGSIDHVGQQRRLGLQEGKMLDNPEPAFHFCTCPIALMGSEINLAKKDLPPSYYTDIW